MVRFAGGPVAKTAAFLKFSYSHPKSGARQCSRATDITGKYNEPRVRTNSHAAIARAVPSLFLPVYDRSEPFTDGVSVVARDHGGPRRHASISISSTHVSHLLRRRVGLLSTHNRLLLRLK